MQVRFAIAAVKHSTIYYQGRFCQPRGSEKIVKSKSTINFEISHNYDQQKRALAGTRQAAG